MQYTPISHNIKTDRQWHRSWLQRNALLGNFGFWLCSGYSLTHKTLMVSPLKPFLNPNPFNNTPWWHPWIGMTHEWLIRFGSGESGDQVWHFKLFVTFLRQFLSSFVVRHGILSCPMSLGCASALGCVLVLQWYLGVCVSFKLMLWLRFYSVQFYIT